MPVPGPTIDELVETLRRSQLPTVIVEGKDDMLIYRWVEERVGTQNANVLSAGGRDNLLSVYKRRNEYAHLPVAFVADRDMWLFSGIPSNYHDIIWTKGYSIENDLYSGAKLENLLSAEEAEVHQQVLYSIIEWFAFEVEEFLAERPAKVGYHCNRIVPLNQTNMDEEFRNSRGFRLPNEKLIKKINNAYQLQLRGKLLFQMLNRFLNAPKRRPKYPNIALYEIAFKMDDSHALMNRLIQKIERRIAEYSSSK